MTDSTLHARKLAPGALSSPGQHNKSRRPPSPRPSLKANLPLLRLSYYLPVPYYPLPHLGPPRIPLSPPSRPFDSSEACNCLPARPVRVVFVYVGYFWPPALAFALRSLRLKHTTNGHSRPIQQDRYVGDHCLSHYHTPRGRTGQQQRKRAHAAVSRVELLLLLLLLFLTRRAAFASRCLSRCLCLLPAVYLLLLPLSSPFTTNASTRPLPASVCASNLPARFFVAQHNHHPRPFSPKTLCSEPRKQPTRLAHRPCSTAPPPTTLVQSLADLRPSLHSLAPRPHLRSVEILSIFCPGITPTTSANPQPPLRSTSKHDDYGTIPLCRPPTLPTAAILRRLPYTCSLRGEKGY